MRYKYIYENVNTGKKVYSNQKLDLKHLKLVKEFRGGIIKNNIVQK